MSKWAVTEIAHPGLRDVSDDCTNCVELSKVAVAMARVTGSTGSTYCQGGHTVKVVRAIAVIDNGGK